MKPSEPGTRFRTVEWTSILISIYYENNESLASTGPESAANTTVCYRYVCDNLSRLEFVNFSFGTPFYLVNRVTNKKRVHFYRSIKIEMSSIL